MKAIIALVVALLNVSNYYPECGVVTDTTFIGNDSVVTFETMNGNLFCFDGGEDLEEGDMIAVIMNSMGTPNVTDDVIIDVRYCSPVNIIITK